jgi:hypothetical protein
VVTLQRVAVAAAAAAVARRSAAVLKIERSLYTVQHRRVSSQRRALLPFFARMNGGGAMKRKKGQGKHRTVRHLKKLYSEKKVRLLKTS